MRLLMVRHAESLGNIEKRWQGHADYPLSPRGVLQAERIAQRLAALPVDAIYSSSSSRALQTAQIIGSPLGIEPQAEDDLREYNVGSLSGAFIREIKERYPSVYQRLVGIYDDRTTVPGEEGQPAFCARIHRVLWRIVDAHPGQLVVVVSHRGPFTAFLMDWLGLKPGKRPPFEFSNASLSVVDVEYPDVVMIQSLNDTCHLPPDLLSERLL